MDFEFKSKEFSVENIKYFMLNLYNRTHKERTLFSFYWLHPVCALFSKEFSINNLQEMSFHKIISRNDRLEYEDYLNN